MFLNSLSHIFFREAMTDKTTLVGRIEAVRRFNRFYTRKIGVLGEGLLSSAFSLAEARLLYELAHREETTVKELSRDLELEPGYLGHLLRGLRRDGLLRSRPSDADAGPDLLSLTESGQEAFAELNADSRKRIGELLNGLSDAEQERLIEAVETIRDLLGGEPERKAPYIIRFPQPEDMEWIVRRHGSLYAEEYGWDNRFERLVADVVAEFVQRHDPEWERCWIAEKEGINVGSVCLVKKSETTAQLRLLLVEPSARGLGIGRRLVRECTRFAKERGYTKITLWTNSILSNARSIYEKEGYRLVKEDPHDRFGKELIGQYWELDL